MRIPGPPDKLDLRGNPGIEPVSGRVSADGGPRDRVPPERLTATAQSKP
ncbi:hypothetical protein [Streptomyces sp. NPDC086766]